MILQARCHCCDQSFELHQLSTADPAAADRCPHCGSHLGPADLGDLGFLIERHYRALSLALAELADKPGAFTVDSSALRFGLLDALLPIETPPPLHTTSRTVPAWA